MPRKKQNAVPEASLVPQAPAIDPAAISSIVDKLLAPLAEVQRKFVCDAHRFKVARAGRRGGKSRADAALMLKTALEFEKSPVGYFGLTQTSAKEAVWQHLLDLVEECQIPCAVSHPKLRIDFANGSFIALFGADMLQMADRFRGRRFKLVVIDECAFFARLKDLVAKVLLPTLADLRGSVVMTSSPPELPAGLFYDADIGNDKDSWSHYSWTLRDNPHFQKPSDEIDPRTGALFKNRGEEELYTICKLQFEGNWDHPSFRREYLGEWVFDRHALVYPLPEESRLSQYRALRAQQFAIGLNFAQYGKFSIVVLAFSDYSRTTHVIETYTARYATLNKLAILIESFQKKYNTNRLYCHLGGSDAQNEEIIDDFKYRYAEIPLTLSKYKKVPFFQQVVATEMDAGNVLCLKTHTDLFKELDTIVRDANGVEIDGQETLLSDALFTVFLNLYNSHLKTQEKQQLEDEMIWQRIIRESQEEDERY